MPLCGSSLYKFYYLCPAKKIIVVKNTSLILNIVLLIAVAILYVLHFSGSKTETEVSEPQNGAPIDVNIAYINSDTLLKNYDYFTELQKQFEAKRANLESEYETRARGLQNEVNSFQQNAPNMTIAQARAVEENLVKKQQNLLQYQQTLAQNLANEEAKLNDELYERVSEYLKDYGNANNFQLVLTYQKGSGVLFANDSLNITQKVITGLNQAYQQQAADSTAVTE